MSLEPIFFFLAGKTLQEPGKQRGTQQDTITRAAGGPLDFAFFSIHFDFYAHAGLGAHFVERNIEFADLGRIDDPRCPSDLAANRVPAEFIADRLRGSPQVRGLELQIERRRTGC